MLRDISIGPQFSTWKFIFLREYNSLCSNVFSARGMLMSPATVRSPTGITLSPLYISAVISGTNVAKFIPHADSHTHPTCWCHIIHIFFVRIKWQYLPTVDLQNNVSASKTKQLHRLYRQIKMCVHVSTGIHLWVCVLVGMHIHISFHGLPICNSVIK
jgi:hypothetical protein